MNRIFEFVVMLGVSLLMVDCKTTKVVSVGKTAIPSVGMKKEDVFGQLALKAVKADWMSGDLDLDYKGKPMDVGASGTARYRKDSVIWLNVRKFGMLNVARAQVTRDSVFLINYLQSNYMAKDLKYIAQKYNLPADFDVLQNLLLGNPVWLIPKDMLTMTTDSAGNYLLKGSDNRWETTHRIDRESYQVKEMRFVEKGSGKSLAVVYDQYGALADGQVFARFRGFTMNSPATGEVKLTIGIGANPEMNIAKSIKFEIPSHYPKVE